LKKKILFIITYLELGGAQKQLLSILQYLNKDLYDIHLISGSEGYLVEEFKKVKGISLKLSPYLRREINLFFDILAFVHIYRYTKNHSFDIVHVHSPKASVLGRWAAYFAGVKNIIYTVHGWPFHKLMNFFSYWLYWFIEFISAKITNKIVVVSKADFKFAIDSRITKINKLELIYYGIDIDKFSPTLTFRRESFIDNKKIIVVSSFKKQKGLKDFLNVARLIISKISDVRFIVIGNGPMFRAIKKNIKKDGLDNNIQLVGWQKEIEPYYKDASLLLLTSLWEGLPVSLIEAVAVGLPVVTTDTGAVRELIKDGKNGRIVGIKDTISIKEACLNILNHYSNWQRDVIEYRLGTDISVWSRERMINQLHAFYSLLY